MRKITHNLIWTISGLLVGLTLTAIYTGPTPDPASVAGWLGYWVRRR